VKLPRNVDAGVLVCHLARSWGYTVVRQTGSHIRLRTEAPHRHMITIPNHTPLKTGTLSGILKEIGDHKDARIDEILTGL
jgi:predicted RNA binding protein YcfA (HicA-like mRNA interferase family)